MTPTSLVTFTDLLIFLLISGILGTIFAIYYLTRGGSDDSTKI